MVRTLIDFFLIFTAFVFLVLVIRLVLDDLHERKNNKATKEEKENIEEMSKLQSLLDDIIKSANDKNPKKPREVQEFSWRHEGKLNSVKIIIDPNIADATRVSEKEFAELIKGGDAASLIDLVNGMATDEGKKKKMSEVKEFIFSSTSVKQMRQAGMSPEDIVIKMLKSAGRM